MTHRLQITIEARRPLDLLRACKILTGIITGWHVGRCRSDLNTRRTGPGWLLRVEDVSLVRGLEASVEMGRKRKLRIVK